MPKSILAAILIAFGGLHSAAASGLSAVQTVEREIAIKERDGARQTAWSPAMEAETGDRLRYSTRYQNLGAEPGGSAVIAMPVPAGVEYQAGSVRAGRAEVTVSVDGGISFGDERALALANPARITNIRWTFADGIQPGERGEVSFEAIVR